MTIISVIFTLITMMASVGIFYNMYRSQVMEDLKTHVHILKTTEAVLEYIEKDFEEYYVPHIFENICSQYLIRKNRAGEIEPVIEKIGKYY